MARGRNRRSLLLVAIAALSALLVPALAPWFDLEQRLGLPWLFHARGPIAPPADAVIIAIDEASIDRLGVATRPREWPRAAHAKLVRLLDSAGARAIVFDLTFDMPGSSPDDDAALADAMRESGRVVITQSLERTTHALPSDSAPVSADLIVDRPVRPVPAIEQAVAAMAPFIVPKTERVDAYWLHRQGDPDSPTLPVVALRAFRPGAVLPEGATAETAYFNFHGPPRTISTLSYAGVLDAPARPGGLQELAARVTGRVVFVGYSATTPAGQDRMRDDYRTVFSQDDGMNLSGVELLATAFANLVEARPVRNLPTGPRLAMLAGFAIALAALHRWLRPAVAAVASIGLGVAYAVLAYHAFVGRDLWLPLVAPLALQLPLVLLAAAALVYAQARRDRDAVARAFGFFVPDSVVDQMTHHAGPMTDLNRVSFGCCLATDASQYTTLAERMAPRALGAFLNAYFAELFAPVEKSGGSVIDVVGDAMVAVWTAGSPDSGLRRRACKATLEMADAVDRFNAQDAGRARLATRFGLHSGEMLLGSVGAAHHFEYRAVGDIVNTASRLEGLNKTLHTRLLASAQTVDGLDELLVRPLGSFLLAGKSTAVDVVELLGLRDAAPPGLAEACELFGQALERYRNRAWDEAAARLERLLEQRPDDGPARFYRDRCRELAADPPAADWQPTVGMATK